MKTKLNQKWFWLKINFDLWLLLFIVRRGLNYRYKSSVIRAQKLMDPILRNGSDYSSSSRRSKSSSRAYLLPNSPNHTYGNDVAPPSSPSLARAASPSGSVGSNGSSKSKIIKTWGCREKQFLESRSSMTLLFFINKPPCKKMPLDAAPCVYYTFGIA